MQLKQALAVDLLTAQILCRPNHGLMTMYEFGETIGGLERCYYFGHGKDLYHFDHFMGEQISSLLAHWPVYVVQSMAYLTTMHKIASLCLGT